MGIKAGQPGWLQPFGQYHVVIAADYGLAVQFDAGHRRVLGGFKDFVVGAGPETIAAIRNKTRA